MPEIINRTSPEYNEQPQRIMIEIGAQQKSAASQYRINIPPGTKYQLVDVNYNILPTEEDTAEQVIPLVDNSVDEVVISNVLSELGHVPHSNRPRAEKFWQDMYDQGKVTKASDVDPALEEVSYFQKIRTIKDIVRVLKEGGILKIYENYYQYHPEVVGQLLGWLKEHPGLEFTEDVAEEQRIQEFFDEELENRVNEAKKILGNNFDLERDVSISRKHNKVYKVTKKSRL